MPLWIKARMVSGELLAGPIVHTIFVLGMGSPPDFLSASVRLPTVGAFRGTVGGMVRLADRKNDVLQNQLTRQARAFHPSISLTELP